MKKVLLIATTSLQMDGITIVIRNILEMVGSIVKLEILLGKGGEKKYLDELSKKGIRYYITRDRELMPFAYICDLNKVLRSEKYDVIHVHGNSATMALEMWCAWMNGIPIRIAHGHQNKTNHPLIHSIMKIPLNLCATSIVACGKDAGKFLSFFSEAIVVPNCIDIEKFRYRQDIRTKIREELEILDSYVIGHIGRFEKQKNQSFLISIMPELLKYKEETKLLLIGEGSLMDNIKKKAKESGVDKNVIFYGNANNVDELLQAMDVFVLPSLFEGFGISAIEAQAAGLPCVLSDRVPRETKVINDCYYISIDYPNEWISIIDKLDNDRKERQYGADEVKKAGFSLEELRKVIIKIWKI